MKRSATNIGLHMASIGGRIINAIPSLWKSRSWAISQNRHRPPDIAAIGVVAM
jgi:hypothetical protein